MTTPSVLIGWDDERVRAATAHLRPACGFEVVEARTAARCRVELDTRRPSVLVLGALYGSPGPLQLAGEIRRHHPEIRVIVIMPESSEERAVAAVRLGVVDYFSAPFPLDAVAASATRALQEPGSRAKGTPRRQED